MIDIQVILNIRKDYCLGIIAHNLEEDDEFLDPRMDKYMLLDFNVKDSEFYSYSKTLEMICRDVMHFEKNQPNEQEFNAAQQKLKITNMGRVDQSQVASSSAKVGETSINL